MSDQLDTATILAALQRLEANLDARLDRIDARLDRVEARLDQMDARLDRIEARLDALGEEVNALKARVERLEASFATYRTDMLDELGRTRAGLMERMDRLQADIIRQQEENFVNYASLDRVERLARGALEEGRSLADQVNAMYRIVRRLEQQVKELRGDA